MKDGSQLQKKNNHALGSEKILPNLNISFLNVLNFLRKINNKICKVI